MSAATLRRATLPRLRAMQFSSPVQRLEQARLGPGPPFVARLLGDGGGDGSTVLGFARPRIESAAEGLPAVVAVRRTGGKAGAVSVSYRTSEATESDTGAIEARLHARER